MKLVKATNILRSNKFKLESNHEIQYHYIAFYRGYSVNRDVCKFFQSLEHNIKQWAIHTDPYSIYIC